MFIQEQIERNKIEEIKIEEQTQYQINGEFPIKSKFYLDIYKSNKEKTNIEDKLIQDISQLIQSPITKVLNQENMFHTIEPSTKQEMYTAHSKQILEEIISQNPNSLEDINKLIQSQLIHQIPQLKYEIQTEKDKPQQQIKPISSKSRFGKSKGNKKKSKKKNKTISHNNNK